MKRTVFVLAVLVIVAIALAGGTAFILEQNRLGQVRRMAAQAEEKMKEKDYPEAIRLLERAEKEGNGGTARTAFLLGRAHYEQNNAAEAIKHFDRIEMQYGRSDYVPNAMLYKARFAEEFQGDIPEARRRYLEIIEKYPDSVVRDQAGYRLARILYHEGNTAQAKKFLDAIVKNPESPAASEAEFVLGEINMKQLKSPEIGPNDEAYVIKRGDSIWKLSRELKVPGDLIVGINNLNPNALTVGQQIKIPRLDISIVVNKPERTLTVRNGGQFLTKYRVGINSSDARVPAGSYTVSQKHEKGMEHIDDSGKVKKPGDTENPFGSRFIEVRRDMGIHGTNEPEKIGQYISEGYIALNNDDTEELYSIVNKGTPVTIKGRVMQEKLFAP